MTASLKFGISIPPFDALSDPRELAQLAQDAEAAGWDGFFLWDGILFREEGAAICDPWIGLSASAMTTSTINIGPLLVPMARRRPWQVARQALSLDHLSNGRLILGVGLGEPADIEFGKFGDETDARTRAAMLDESLAIMDGLWTGEPFSFTGEHYTLGDMTFLPRPVQQPRIPVWVGGWWPRRKPMQRAARWDGYCPGSPMTPDDWRQALAEIHALRGHDGPFDAVNFRPIPTDRSERETQAAAYAAVGVSWWVNDCTPLVYGLDWDTPDWVNKIADRVKARVRMGPSGDQ